MDKLSFQNQLEHLQSKYIGTGNSDTTRHEWLTNQHRDSLSSYISHPNLLRYMSLAQNESLARTRFNVFQKMIQPCGPAPAAKNLHHDE